MVALSIETVLLMAAAYFIGAALACIIRRSLFAARPATVAERRVEPLPEVVARNAEAARFAPRSAPAPQRAPAPGAAVPAPPAPAAGPQDLQNIFNIDAATATSLNKLGVARYEQIAAWKRGRRRPLQPGARTEGAHQPGELDRAGPDPGEGRNDPLRPAARRRGGQHRGPDARRGR